MSVLIIAEIGSTHDGSLGNAIALARECLLAGANVVKFQDHLDDRASLDVEGPSRHESRADYLARLAGAWAPNDWVALAGEVRQADGLYAVSPFSRAAAERQQRWTTPDVWKIASGQVTNRPMLEFIATTKRRTIVSTGLCTAAELDAACGILGNPEVLICTTRYPCAPEEVRFDEWCDAWDSTGSLRYAGLSDHTEGSWACIAAVAKGAGILEKHVTFDKRMYGSDAAHAMQVDDFGDMVEAVRELERAMSPARVRDKTAEMRSRYMYGRTVTV